MAQLVKRNNFFKRKKKLEHFKLKCKSFVFKCSVFTNIALGVHIYDPNIIKELTNKFIDVYFKVAPIMESLFNKLPL